MVKISIKGDMSQFSSFACYLYGRWISFTSWIYMTLIFEHYLAYSCSILSQILVCYSWDHGLQKRCTLFFNQMLGSCRNFQLKVEIAHFLELWRIFFIIIRWSVFDRLPIVFVRIFFLYLLFIYFLHFFVPTITQVRFRQFHSILAQSKVIVMRRDRNLFKVIKSSWRHPGAILCF